MKAYFFEITAEITVEYALELDIGRYWSNEISEIQTKKKEKELHHFQSMTKHVDIESTNRLVRSIWKWDNPEKKTQRKLY